MIMRKISCALLLFIISFNIIAQMPKKDPEEAVRFLADKILATTSFELMNFNTGETFNDSENLPIIPEIRVKSKLADWHYENGVMNLAMLYLGEYFGEKKYTNYTLNNYEFIYRCLPYFKKQYENPDIKKPSLHQFHNFEYLDNCGTMGAALIETFKKTGQVNQDYLKTVNRIADYIMTKEHRMDDGTFCRTYPREYTIWADDLYMAVIFLSRMGEFTGNHVYFDEASKQVQQFTSYLMDDHKKVFYHAYFSNIDKTNHAHWGRANGWVMMAQVELLSVLPENHPDKEILKEILLNSIDGISALQSGNGMWHQLLDKTDSYLESSCTAMFVYGIAKAVNNGWIDPAYAQVAWKGWRGIYNNITEDAQVKDICVGTHVEWNLPFYYHRPLSVNDTHGLASTLLAGTEITKLSKSFPERVNPGSY